MKTYNVQMHGYIRFYFPDFPNHPLNGMFAHGRQGSRPKAEDGKFQMGYLLGYHKSGDVRITAADFGTNKVLVKQWYAPDYDQPTEEFYLVK